MTRRSETFGDLVRSERQQRSWSRRALAQRLHRAPSVIQNIEEGISAPSVDTFAALGVIFEWDFNRAMRYFGVKPVDNADRLGSEIAVRPGLRRLVLAARTLDGDSLERLSTIAEAWRGDEGSNLAADGSIEKP